MRVAFDSTQVQENSTIGSKTARGDLALSWTAEPDKFYTLVIYDMTAPSAKDTSDSPFVNYLIINIPGNRVDEGHVLASYMPPVPSPGSGTHSYLVELYEQKGYFEDTFLLRRERANLMAIYPQWQKPTLVDEFRFQVTNQPLIKFGNTPVLEEGKVEFETSQQPLTVDWSAQPDQLYTVAVYDLSAPSESNPYNSPYLHFLAVNVPGKDISRGEILAGYVPPSPPPGSGPHRFVVDIYEQTDKISAAPVTERTKYDPTQLANITKSRLDHRSTFYVLSEGKEVARKGAREWMRPKSPLPEEKQKYCRCVLRVAAKQPGQCNVEKAWFQKRQGRTCYNPYAVCAASVGTTSRQCGLWYDLKNIPDDELTAYASLNKVPIPSPYDREQMLKNLDAWMEQKYGVVE